MTLVTGASSGIGRATAILLNERGHRVVAVGRDEARLAETAGAAPHPDAILAVRTDVTDPVAVDDCVRRACETFGRVDGLVTAAAAAPPPATVDEMTLDQWHQAIAVCLHGTFHCCRAVLPHLRRQRSGAIVTFSSVLAHATLPGSAAYCAAKGGVEALTRCLALDHAREGIRANCLVSGSADTPMMWAGIPGPDLPETQRQAGHEQPSGRVASPVEMATVVAFLLSPDASFVSGASVVVDGGLLARIAGHQWTDQAPG